MSAELITIEVHTSVVREPLPPTPYHFPDAAKAMEDGALAAGGDFAPATIVAAYRAGVFPWPHPDIEQLWYSPDPRAILPALINHAAPLAVVGHEPHLSALASQLVTGATYPVAFAMKKGTVLALERGSSTRWVVRWHVEPDLFA